MATKADFTEEEADPLVSGLNLSRIEATLFLRWVLSWTNGHPYLTLRVFRKFQEESRDWVTDETVIRQLFFGKGESPDSNLEFIRKMIVRDDPIRNAVLDTYELICHGQPVRDDSSTVKTRLKLSGLVSAAGGELHVRNRIYQETFDHAWLSAVRTELRRRSAKSAVRSKSSDRGISPPLEDTREAVYGQTAKRLGPMWLTRDSLERSVLLATESIQANVSREAFEFLRQNMPLLRRQVFRIDHAQRVTCAAFSPDGEFAASASEDGTARIFEIATGLEVAVASNYRIENCSQSRN